MFNRKNQSAPPGVAASAPAGSGPAAGAAAVAAPAASDPAPGPTAGESAADPTGAPPDNAAPAGVDASAASAPDATAPDPKLPAVDGLYALVAAAARAAERAGDHRSAGALIAIEGALGHLRLQVQHAAPQLPEHADLVERIQTVI
jgi:hypothetical protein